MALSNIFREPRREITETVIGVAVVGGILYGDYALASALVVPGPAPDGMPYEGKLAIAMLVFPIFIAVGCGLFGLALVGIHAVGEGICNKLQTAGIHLRPRTRERAPR